MPSGGLPVSRTRISFPVFFFSFLGPPTGFNFLFMVEGAAFFFAFFLRKLAFSQDSAHSSKMRRLPLPSQGGVARPMWSDGVQILEVGGVMSDEGGYAPLIRTPPPCFAPEVFLEPGPLR